MQAPLDFDWRDENAERHLEKHGVTFDFAIRVFLDDRRLEEQDLREPHDPPRFNTIGCVDGICINVTFAMDGDTAIVIPLDPRADGNEDAMAHRTLAELKADPPKLSLRQRARLDAMTDDEIDTNAKDDLINPEWTTAQLDRAVFARDVRETRDRLGLTQASFAARFHIALSRLRDWEQARYAPDSVAAAYIKTIRHDARAVEKALAARE